MGIRAKFVRAANAEREHVIAARGNCLMSCMRTQHLSAALGVAALLASAACSNNVNRQPANEPLSRATTTGVAAESGPGASGVTSGNAPAEGGIRVSSGAPASMMEGACPQAAPLPSARDRAACMKSCRGLDEAVPPGSKCISQRQSCETQCASKYDNR
jgi:hypothetical protein